MKRVLVAGSTGYLGGFVCQELEKRGHEANAILGAPEITLERWLRTQSRKTRSPSLGEAG